MVANNSIVLVNALGGAPIANKVLRTGCNFVPVTRAFSQVITEKLIHTHTHTHTHTLSHTYFPPT